MKKQKLPIILFSALAVLLLVYFLFISRNNARNQFQWTETYKVKSDQPYGTLFIKRLLESYKDKDGFYVNDARPIKHLLNSEKIRDSTDYVFIGQSIFLDKSDRLELLKFIEAGNDAFIASLGEPSDLLYDMHISRCDEDISYSFNLAKSVILNFFNDSLRKNAGYKYQYRFGPKDQMYNWSHINEDVFCESQDAVLPIGYLNEDNINFVKIPLGKGNLYLHCNPLVFTNYFLTQEENLKYASAVFSHLRGRKIFWDEFSKVPYAQNQNSFESPLYYILQQPSLKYAWWLLLLTVVLYVFFAAKRTQRIIPVLEPKTNTSLEFVKLIAALHFKNKNHLDMAKKKMKYFMFFVRSKYGLHAQHFTDDHIQGLAEKSGVDITDIKKIIHLYNSIDHSTTWSINEYMLINFYNAVNTFYKQCK